MIEIAGLSIFIPTKIVLELIPPRATHNKIKAAVIETKYYVCESSAAVFSSI